MGGSAASEIPLLPMLFYLSHEVASSHPLGCLVLALRGCLGGRRLRGRRASGGEFGWGGTSVTREHRCPKVSSMRTEISCRTKG